MMKVLVAEPSALRGARRASKPPPLWIRGLLVLTCTGVSFAHGCNDGQKGMGLIMLILIGAAPTAYALNRTMPDEQHAGVRASARRPRRRCSQAHAGSSAPPATPRAARATVGDALQTKTVNSPRSMPRSPR